MVILNLYYSLYSKQIYSSPDHFPVNYIENLSLPIFGNSDNKGYFYRHYQEKEISHIVSPEELFKYKYEIINGQYIDDHKYFISCSEDSIFPISLETQKNVLTLEDSEKKIDVLKNLPVNRFHYFKVYKNSTYKISSEGNFVIGDPINLKQKIKHKKKLVLCLFVDGLVDPNIIDHLSYEKIMPFTSNFFKKGVTFKNHFSNAEWTLPSVPSFFTGRRQQGHGFFHPKENHVLGKNDPILSELFKENNYLTFQASGNWRMSPAYGYIKGFERTIYKKEMDAKEIIFSFLEHMRTFKDRDNFAWLSFSEVHHLLKVIPDISSQLENSVSAHRVTPWYDHDNKTKSVFSSKDNALSEIYENEIKRLDYYLKIIYDFIENNFKSNEVLVTLVSDHGQAFLTNDQHPLSIQRTKVPWMIRGEGIPQKDSSELTENIDVFEALVKCCSLKTDDFFLDSHLPVSLGGDKEKEFVLSQSIYPGQTYKAVIRDKFYEYRFESEVLVQPNGAIQGKVDLKETFIINEKERSVLSYEIEKYKAILIVKIDEWNNNL
ncbi:sulfatase-like hydrolase/transferase [Candidatus Pseudothioglobus singularis]|nr:sulfatase-like hydrolase/transferase [Candidatus Pseudothioglobus singularis]